MVCSRGSLLTRFIAFFAILVALVAKPIEAIMTRVAVVTGSNKGIGLQIAKKLAQTPGHVCVLTSRDHERGEKAARDLQGEGVNTIYKQLDIGDRASVERFAIEMEVEYGRCDILVNNAGIAFKGSDPTPFMDQAEPTLKTNFFDTVAFTERMLPLVRKSSAGRIVNVASGSGHLNIIGDKRLRDSFTDAALSKEKLSQMMMQFVEDVKTGSHGSKGWPNTCYGMSKLGLIAYTKVAARVEQEAGSNVFVNSCCPGYCDTDMTSHMGRLTAEEGARTPFMLTQLKGKDEDGVTGGFFQREALAVW